jgi:hypothetical protein
MFSGQPQLISWQQQYGIDFDTWNRCHYLQGDIGSLALDHNTKFLKIPTNLVNSESEKNFILHYRAISDNLWPEIQSINDYKKLPQYIRDEVEQQFNLTVPNVDSTSKITMLSQSIEKFLPVEHTDFLNHHSETYQHTNNAIAKLVDQKIITTPPPIKKQTLAEKKYIIKNFEQCLEVYNQWIAMNPTIGNPVESDIMTALAESEYQRWKPDIIGSSYLNPTNLLSD